MANDAFLGYGIEETAFFAKPVMCFASRDPSADGGGLAPTGGGGVGSYSRYWTHAGMPLCGGSKLKGHI